MPGFDCRLAHVITIDTLLNRVLHDEADHVHHILLSNAVAPGDGLAFDAIREARGPVDRIEENHSFCDGKVTPAARVSVPGDRLCESLVVNLLIAERFWLTLPRQ